MALGLAVSPAANTLDEKPNISKKKSSVRFKDSPRWKRLRSSDPPRLFQPPPDIANPCPPLPPIASSGRLSTVTTKIGDAIGRFRKEPIQPQSPKQYGESILHDELEDTKPRDTRLAIKENDVLRVVLGHKSFSMRGVDIALTDFPSLDSLEVYGVDEEQSRTLWTKEIHRLVTYVNDPDQKLRFSSPTFLREGSPDAYCRLSSLAKRILDCNHIRAYDNEALYAAHHEDLRDTEDHDKYQIHLTRLERATMDDNLTDRESRIDIFALVDYLTASFARFLCQSAHGSEWHNHVLALLSTWSTAVKVISERPSTFARLALDTAADRIQKAENNDRKQMLSEATGVEKGQELLREILKFRYFKQRRRLRKLESSLTQMLLNLMDYKDDVEDCLTKYELCSVVYETGFEGFQTLLSQVANGELMGTSAPACLNIAHSACAILNEIVETVRKDPHRPPPPRKPVESPLETKFRWVYNDNEEQESTDIQARSLNGKTVTPNEMSLESMEDIITITIPILLTTPWIVSEIFDAINVFAHTCEGEEPTRYYASTKFKAFFRMYTNLFESSRNSQGMYVSSLSRGLMTRDKLLAGPTIALGPESTKNMCETTPPNNSRLIDATSMAKAGRTMDEWIFDEKAVIVQCPLYVWSVITAASILVIGGMVIGFTVKGRIAAVDPFNITTYCWVLAAFLVLICKSVRVDNWSWRDFLHFRVQCRSVSELHDVSGVPEQLIIAKLLHEEHTTILRTRGPYNSAFKRKADDGFSIDVPLTMWTMLLSGLIMVQVMRPSGRALACLDVRRGKKYTCVIHDSNPSSASELLVCIDPVTSHQGRGRGKKQLFSLHVEKLEWRKVQGLFNMQNAEFM